MRSHAPRLAALECLCLNQVYVRDSVENRLLLVNVMCYNKEGRAWNSSNCKLQN